MLSHFLCVALKNSPIFLIIIYYLSVWKLRVVPLKPDELRVATLEGFYFDRLSLKSRIFNYGVLGSMPVEL